MEFLPSVFPKALVYDILDSFVHLGHVQTGQRPGRAGFPLSLQEASWVQRGKGTGGETGQMAERFVPGERAQEVVAPEKSSAGKLVVGLGRETYSND